MFRCIEKLEERVFEEFEVIEVFKPNGFNSKEEEDHFIDNFIKKMDSIDVEPTVESNNFKNSNRYKILKEWLESDK